MNQSTIPTLPGTPHRHRKAFYLWNDFGYLGKLRHRNACGSIWSRLVGGAHDPNEPGNGLQHG